MRLLVTYCGDDALKARLPACANHPRALLTLLEGVSLWHGHPLYAALAAQDPSQASCIDRLLGGDLWPQDSANVRFTLHYPQKSLRIRGPGSFGRLYRIHGGLR